VRFAVNEDDEQDAGKGGDAGQGHKDPSVKSPLVLKAGARARTIEALKRQQMKAQQRATAPIVPTPHLVAAAADSRQWVRLVHVKGDSGTLTGLGVAGGPDYHHFKVGIDGSTLTADFLAGTGAAAGHVNNGIGVGLPFAGELTVHARDEPAPSAITRYWVAYVTDHSEQVDESWHTESVEGKEYAYRTQVYRKPDGETYVVDSLVGPRHAAHIRLARDWVRLEDYSRGEGGRVWLGAEVLRVGPETEDSASPTGAVVRVAGRQSIVSEVRLAGIEEPVPVEIPAPGEYSIAAALDGYANVPAFFTVL
jgi:hypothetical protein